MKHRNRAKTPATSTRAREHTPTAAKRKAADANGGLKRSVRPSPQRYSIATVRPSVQPSSRSRCTKAAVHGPQVEGVAVPKNPMIGSFCPREELAADQEPDEPGDAAR